MAAQPLYRIHEGGRLAAREVELPQAWQVEEVAGRLQELSYDMGAIACSVHTDTTLQSTSLRFVNYPRAKHGNRRADDIRATAGSVAAALRGWVLPKESPQNRLQPNLAVIGLRRGYDGDDIASPDQMRTAILSGAEPFINFTDLSVVSVSPESCYVEPALGISFTYQKTLKSLAKVATEYGQERFSLEVPRLSRVFMIETPHCSEPDATPYVRSSAGGAARYVFRLPV